MPDFDINPLVEEDADRLNAQEEAQRRNQRAQGRADRRDKRDQDRIRINDGNATAIEEADLNSDGGRDRDPLDLIDDQITAEITRVGGKEAAGKKDPFSEPDRLDVLDASMAKLIKVRHDRAQRDAERVNKMYTDLEASLKRGAELQQQRESGITARAAKAAGREPVHQQRVVRKGPELSDSQVAQKFLAGGDARYTDIDVLTGPQREALKRSGHGRRRLEQIDKAREESVNQVRSLLSRDEGNRFDTPQEFREAVKNSPSYRPELDTHFNQLASQMMPQKLREMEVFERTADMAHASTVKDLHSRGLLSDSDVGLINDTDTPDDDPEKAAALNRLKETKRVYGGFSAVGDQIHASKGDGGETLPGNLRDLGSGARAAGPYTQEQRDIAVAAYRRMGVTEADAQSAVSIGEMYRYTDEDIEASSARFAPKSDLDLKKVDRDVQIASGKAVRQKLSDHLAKGGSVTGFLRDEANAKVIQDYVNNSGQGDYESAIKTVIKDAHGKAIADLFPRLESALKVFTQAGISGVNKDVSVVKAALGRMTDGDTIGMMIDASQSIEGIDVSGADKIGVKADVGPTSKATESLVTYLARSEKDVQSDVIDLFSKRADGAAANERMRKIRGDFERLGFAEFALTHPELADVMDKVLDRRDAVEASVVQKQKSQMEALKVRVINDLPQGLSDSQREAAIAMTVNSPNSMSKDGEGVVIFPGKNGRQLQLGYDALPSEKQKEFREATGLSGGLEILGAFTSPEVEAEFGQSKESAQSMQAMVTLARVGNEGSRGMERAYAQATGSNTKFSGQMLQAGSSAKDFKADLASGGKYEGDKDGYAINRDALILSAVEAGVAKETAENLVKKSHAARKILSRKDLTQEGFIEAMMAATIDAGVKRSRDAAAQASSARIHFDGQVLAAISEMEFTDRSVLSVNGFFDSDKTPIEAHKELIKIADNPSEAYTDLGVAARKYKAHYGKVYRAPAFPEKESYGGSYAPSFGYEVSKERSAEYKSLAPPYEYPGVYLKAGLIPTTEKQTAN